MLFSYLRGLQDYLLSYGGKDGQKTNECNDFVVDFERANFQEGRKLALNSSFEELQKASLDLEKRLHERIVKSAEARFEDSNDRIDTRQRQGIATISQHNRSLFFKLCYYNILYMVMICIWFLYNFLYIFFVISWKDDCTIHFIAPLCASYIMQICYQVYTRVYMGSVIFNAEYL